MFTTSTGNADNCEKLPNEKQPESENARCLRSGRRNFTPPTPLKQRKRKKCSTDEQKSPECSRTIRDFKYGYPSTSTPEKNEKRVPDIAVKLLDSVSVENTQNKRQSKKYKRKSKRKQLKTESITTKTISSIHQSNDNVLSISDSQNANKSVGDDSDFKVEMQTNNVAEDLNIDSNLGLNESDLTTDNCANKLESTSEAKGTCVNEPFDPNLDVDTCDSPDKLSVSSESSDDELLNFSGLAPVKVDKPVDNGDVVWIKRSKLFVPAYVKSFDKQKKKMTLMMFGSKKEIKMKFSSRTVVPYYHKRKEKFEKAGSQLPGKEKADFLASLSQVEDYLMKKGLDKLADDLSFFRDDGHVYIVSDSSQEVGAKSEASDEEEDKEEKQNKSAAISSPFPSKGSTPSHTPKRGRKKSDKTEDWELSKRGQISLEKRNEKSQQLCNYLVSEECKQYLIKIFNKEVPSDLHNTFMDGSLKKRESIKYQGFGPIDAEHQIDLLVQTFSDWLKGLPLPSFEIIGYVFDVWVPEAIVYGLKKLKGYSKSRAWEMFHKGVRSTKEELQLVMKEFDAKFQRKNVTPKK